MKIILILFWLSVVPAFGQHRPDRTPLPDLNRPVYVKTGSILCDRDHEASMAMVDEHGRPEQIKKYEEEWISYGSCARAPVAFRVLLLIPNGPNESYYLDTWNIIRVQWTAPGTAATPAHIYAVWAKVKDLRN